MGKEGREMTGWKTYVYVGFAVLAYWWIGTLLERILAELRKIRLELKNTRATHD